jgi:hypothetical protein
LRAGHMAVALLGALLWAAGLQAALQLVAGGALAGAPLLPAAAALIAVIVEFRQRGARPAGLQAPIPRHQPVSGTGVPSFTDPQRHSPAVSGGGQAHS